MALLRKILLSRDSTIPAEAISSMVHLLMGKFGTIGAAVASTATEAFYDNSYVDEIKQSGFLKELWK
jgi:hypothetical protein